MSIKIKGEASRPICSGQTLTLETEILNEQPGLTYTYQWYKDDAPIPGPMRQPIRLMQRVLIR